MVRRFDVCAILHAISSYSSSPQRLLIPMRDLDPTKPTPFIDTARQSSMVAVTDTGRTSFFPLDLMHDMLHCLSQPVDDFEVDVV